ncbi:polysaccharide deacetylase family protein [[Clostridium] polysaccharolyticum]|uniref:Peptidoglycan/xylan/chitin deacetylase, PgdA/CDA1 family n=1 Tax=[Clostridium] polysaccharolyticum TaxID=29364 RepID=A0A1H9YW48_9FIRM|nr:polysaccharide deacetylase family protein [[Clostridium] polysaccharolyticum]SES72909.1 Peptidoglycan/xylan/chitin deacetylase, PgdA/CDA1 family [[Clostridium] polysaccharolyticum]
MNTEKQETNRKLVALTFDDGPSETTPKILDILEKYNIKATFFLIGNLITKETKPIMERELRMGCEIANHSFTHSDMAAMTGEQIREEIDKTTKLIKETVGYDVKFFRPPYISLSDEMYENIDLPFIVGLGCRDWEPDATAKERKEIVLNEVKDGTLVLLHDFIGNDNTVEALPGIIEGLKEQGYTFVTASEIFLEKGIDPNVKRKLWTNVFG